MTQVVNLLPMSNGSVTELLHQVSLGDKSAETELIALVYHELHVLAAAYLRHERPGHTLQATALVHEAYMRLTGQKAEWSNRHHFYAFAAKVMRRILVDHSRRRRTSKRGGDGVRVPLEEMDQLNLASRADCELSADLDEALVRLEEFAPRQAKIVELRFFGGMSEVEIGEFLGISDRTVKRDWAAARAWLFGELSN